jgi:hypothetical protein
MNQARLQRQLLGRIRRDDQTGCWNWSGQVSSSGYGRTMIADEDGNTRMASAHAASYEAFIGPPPKDKLVKQRCGNRLCINPDHLMLFEPGSAKG